MFPCCQRNGEKSSFTNLLASVPIPLRTVLTHSRMMDHEWSRQSMAIFRGIQSVLAVLDQHLNNVTLQTWIMHRNRGSISFTTKTIPHSNVGLKALGGPLPPFDKLQALLSASEHLDVGADLPGQAAGELSSVTLEYENNVFLVCIQLLPQISLLSHLIEHVGFGSSSQQLDHEELCRLLQSPNSKIPAHLLQPILVQYVESLKENSRLLLEIGKVRAKYDNLISDYDDVRLHLKKTLDVKTKLEGLCRQLRQDFPKSTLSSSNPKPLSDVESSLVEQQQDSESKLRTQLKLFLEQYEVREKHFHSSLQSKQIELQISAAKLYDQKKLADELNGKLHEANARAENSQRKETFMRQQLTEYMDQFKRIQETLHRNNELFSKFRLELEQTNTKIKKLESENQLLRSNISTAFNVNSPALSPSPDSPATTKPSSSSWKMGGSSAQKAFNINSAKQKGSKPIAVLPPDRIASNDNRSERERKLESLCRALAEERTNLKKQLEALTCSKSKPPSKSNQKSDPPDVS